MTKKTCGTYDKHFLQFSSDQMDRLRNVLSARSPVPFPCSNLSPAIDGRTNLYSTHPYFLQVDFQIDFLRTPWITSHPLRTASHLTAHCWTMTRRPVTTTFTAQGLPLWGAVNLVEQQICGVASNWTQHNCFLAPASHRKLQRTEVSVERELRAQVTGHVVWRLLAHSLIPPLFSLLLNRPSSKDPALFCISSSLFIREDWANARCRTGPHRSNGRRSLLDGLFKRQSLNLLFVRDSIFAFTFLYEKYCHGKNLGELDESWGLQTRGVQIRCLGPVLFTQA